MEEIPVEGFEDVVLRRTLYLPARWLRPLLCGLDRNYFWSDREFVGQVGRLARSEDFSYAYNDFVVDRSSYRFLRWTLKLRVSTHKMRRLVHQVFDAEPHQPVAAAGRSRSA